MFSCLHGIIAEVPFELVRVRSNFSGSAKVGPAGLRSVTSGAKTWAHPESPTEDNQFDLCLDTACIRIKPALQCIDRALCA